jgi:hypothetical protein
MKIERLAPWIGMLVAGSCALPELTIDENLGATAGEAGEGPGGGGTNPSGGKAGTAGSQTGGRTTGGSNSGGKAGGTSSGNGGMDDTGGSSMGGTESSGGTGGTMGSGGSATGGEAGSDAMGGTGGSMGGTGGSGGSDAMGGTAGSNGGSGDTGGSAGSGGNAGSSMAGAAGGMGVTVAAIAGALDGRLIQIPCSGTTTTDDCPTASVLVDGNATTCSNSQLEAIIDHPIGGEDGVTYDLTLHFYGVVSPKVYGSQVTREAQNTRPANLDTGAEPAPWASADPGATFQQSTYDAFEFHVYDDQGTEIRAYLVNSDTVESRLTYVLNFERTISVIGGGMVRFRYFDTNCRIMKNCKAGPYPCADKARIVDVAGASPAPLQFTQPGMGNTDDNGGLWLLIDATAVSEPSGA